MWFIQLFDINCFCPLKDVAVLIILFPFFLVLFGNSTKVFYVKDILVRKYYLQFYIGWEGGEDQVDPLPLLFNSRPPFHSL